MKIYTAILLSLFLNSICSFASEVKVLNSPPTQIEKLETPPWNLKIFFQKDKDSNVYEQIFVANIGATATLLAALFGFFILIVEVGKFPRPLYQMLITDENITRPLFITSSSMVLNILALTFKESLFWAILSVISFAISLFMIIFLGWKLIEYAGPSRKKGIKKLLIELSGSVHTINE